MKTSSELVENIDKNGKIPPGLIELGILLVKEAVEAFRKRAGLKHRITALELENKLIDERLDALEKKSE